MNILIFILLCYKFFGIEKKTRYDCIKKEYYLRYSLIINKLNVNKKIFSIDIKKNDEK